MIDLPLRLSAVLEALPVAVVLVARDGRCLAKTGGMASMVGRALPIIDPREARRWSFRDKGGSALPHSQWPTARALRGERCHAGMRGAFVDGETRAVKVISMPTFDSSSDVAAIAFLQVFDTPSPSIAGSHHDLQERLIDDLVRALAASRQPRF